MSERFPTCFANVLLPALGMAACSGDPSPMDAALPGISLLIVSGDGQQAFVGQELPSPLVVQVLDDKNRPVKDQLVNFRVRARRWIHRDGVHSDRGSRVAARRDEAAIGQLQPPLPATRASKCATGRSHDTTQQNTAYRLFQTARHGGEL